MSIIQIQRGVGVIPKSAHANRIQENTQLFDFSLSNEEMTEIFSFNRGEEGRVIFKAADNGHPHYPFNGEF